MIKFIIKFLAFGLIVLLGFYFFMGSPEDKDRAKAVFSEAGDLFGELGNFLKTEKEKFDRGDYQDELDKIRELVADIKAKAARLSSLQESTDGAQAVLLDQKADELERLLMKEDLTEEEITALKEKLRSLQTEANELAGAEGNTELPKLL